jgi:small-conductance mechanosensitive channel
MQEWMKSRKWLIPLGLMGLVLAAIVASFLTADLGGSSAGKNTEATTDKTKLVDESPLETARTMGKLATGREEQKQADLAAELGDSSVDLAFHDALQDAADHPPRMKPQFKPLEQHINEAQETVKADQDAVNDLKKRLAAADAAHQEDLQEQLDVAQAQLELDQDELNDAHEDLVRAGGDPGALIQRQFDQHQATEHGADQQLKMPAATTAAPVFQTSSMVGQFLAWRELHGTTDQLQQSHDQAVEAVTTLTKAHEDLEKQVEREKTNFREGKPIWERDAAGTSPAAETAGPTAPVPAATSGSASAATSAAQGTSAAPGNSAAAAAAQTSKSAVKALHVISDDQKTLADLDKRIQDQQELQNTYLNWIGLVKLRQRAALHGIIQSALWILLILLTVYLTDRAIDHYLLRFGEEWTRVHTLRAVIHFAVQAVGALLILLVIFGVPQQLPTIIGFAGAGLTVALKDFIVGFVGWFVLMGKNGIRVGDWVEINGVAGEVIEINLLRTILLETGNWTDTGHPTGRKVAFINSYAIEGHFFNFTTSGQWLWDELQITVPASVDPYVLIEQIQKVVAKETEANVKAAEEEWKGLTTQYRVRSVSAAPAVTLRPTASGVDLHVRYITRAQDRFAMRARLNQALVEVLRNARENATAAK